MEPTIREARDSDLKAIHRIELGSYSDPWPRSIFHLMRGRAPDLFLVAESEDGIVGYTVGEMEKREASRIGHIMNLAIEVGWRRKKLAGKLMENIENRFRQKGAKYAYLEVRSSNSSAISLYEKRGYVEIGRLQQYYVDEDGITMKKEL